MPKKRTPREERVELVFLEGVRRRMGDDPDLLKALGDLYTKAGRCEEGLAVDEKLVRLCPREPLVWFNLGCSLALQNRKEEALAALTRAVDLGYGDVVWMRKDPDLESLRGAARFRELLKRMAERRGIPFS